MLLEGVLPPVGTRMAIIPSRTFIQAETENEFHERREADAKAVEVRREQLRQQEAAQRHDRLVRRQEIAETENAKLLIPVRWTSGHKTVLSGLSENSWGNGENARSVVHVLLLEDIEDGRFKREANSFLCTTASGTDGRDWTGNRETSDVGVNGDFVSCITCRSCLKLAARWTDPDKAIAPEVVQETSSTVFGF